MKKLLLLLVLTAAPVSAYIYNTGGVVVVDSVGSLPTTESTGTVAYIQGTHTLTTWDGNNWTDLVSTTSNAAANNISGSSAAVSYTAISTDALKVTYSSAAASYLAISTVGAATSIYSPYGTGYTFTATTGTLNVAGSSITITLGTAGTYLLKAEANLTYNAATFAANQTVTLAIYRQNNTPGVVTNAFIQSPTRIITTITDDAGYYATPMVIYTTANTNDVLSFHGSITVIPSAGSFQAKRASLLAIRLH